jgi:DHA1 family bicyclomycin/chloramphenicol resistance-like MFS transporter
MTLAPTTKAMTVLLAFMTAVGPLTMDIYLASLPHIGAALQASTSSVQLTISLYVFGFSIGQLFYGPLSDIYGRKPVALIALMTYVTASILCVLATSIEALILGRIIQAIGAAGPIIIARAIVRDLHSGAKAARQLGLMSAIMGATPIGAPILGGFLQDAFGWRASFIFVCFAGIALWAAVLFLLPETRSRQKNQKFSFYEVLRNYGAVVRSRVFLSYVVTHSLSYIGIFAFLSGSSHVMQRVFGFAPSDFGFLFSLCAVSYISAAYVSANLVERLGIQRMLKLGTAILAFGGGAQLALYALFPTWIAPMLIGQMIYFFGSGMMQPQLIAGAMAPFGERAGTASSVMGVSQMGSAAVSGSLLGLILGETAWPVIALIACTGLASFCAFRFTAHLRH